MVDSTADEKDNAFSKSMKVVYQMCAKDKNRKDITKRSCACITDFLAQEGKKSPFVIAKKDVIAKILKAHKDTITQRIQPSAKKILDRLRTFLNDLLDTSAEEANVAELAAKKKIASILPVLQNELKSKKQDLEDIRKKYEKSG